MATRAKKAPKQYRGRVTEAELQDTVVEMAERLGWKVFWLPDFLYTLAIKAMARGRRGDRRWSPPGFPDLVMVQGLQDERRPVRLIFAELKSDTGRLRVPQHDWIKALRRVAGIEVYVFDPSDWHDGSIEKILTNGPMPNHENTERHMTRKPAEQRGF